MCGPKFCSMRISHDIRAEAQKEGLDAMAVRYREGGDLYMPVQSLQRRCRRRRSCGDSSRLCRGNRRRQSSL
jgi:hypothetical protein